MNKKILIKLSIVFGIISAILFFYMIFYNKSIGATGELKFKDIQTACPSNSGEQYSIAIDDDGNLWSWGGNSYGQLGIGDLSIDKVQYPTQIKIGTKFSYIFCSGWQVLAIDTEGNLYEWGHIEENGTYINVAEPTIKDYSGIKFSKIVKGFYNNANYIAIDKTGKLWTWGSNEKGQLGNGTTTDSEMPIQIKENTTFKDIATGNGKCYAIDTSGNLWGWGYGFALGNSNVVTEEAVTTPVQIKSGTTFEKIIAKSQNFCAFAIDTSGNLWGWGKDLGQLGIGEQSSGYQYIPVQIKQGTAFKEVYNNDSFGTHAIDSNGNIWAWGSNSEGVLGDGTTDNTKVPIQITTGTKYIKLASDWYTTQAIDEDGKIWLLGYVSSSTRKLVKWDISKYTVEHYKQNIDLSTYELVETENKTGETGALAVATEKTYEGFTRNTDYSENILNGNIVSDGSLVLKLYYNRNTYNVTLNTNEGTINSGNVTTYAYGVGATLPTDITKTGYTFAGWYDNSEFTGNEITTIVETETGDKTYYAKWTQNEFTVTFKDGAQVVKTETVNYASAATAPELTKAGYTLSWDKEFNNVISDLTVNAVWTANINTPYKVEHYKRNLDSEVEGYDLFETEDLTGTTYETVTATAKTYEGFTENTSYTGRVASGTIAGDGSLVLKLYYDRNTYNIAYELNGGTATGELSSSYMYGKELILSNRVEKQGYVFAGWYDNTELTGNAITSIGITETGDKTYYAKWTQEDEYYITSDKHNIDIQENYITKVSPNTSAQELVNNLNTNGIVKILNSEGEELASSSLVGTGCKVQVDYKGAKYEYEVAVRGDIDGNGKITVTDLSMLNQVLVKKLTVTGIKEKATDIDYSGKITVTDLSMINQAIVGKINL